MRRLVLLLAIGLTAVACSSSTPPRHPSSSSVDSSSRTSLAPAPTPTVAPSSSHATSPTPHVRPKAQGLPLHDDTSGATQVLTVTTSAASNTTATMQAWQRSATGWTRVGPSVPAHLGGDGMSAHPSEASSATPEGSFTLTRAFGRNANPGTALPYRQTTPADWWISQPGPLYNTLQRCASGCAFTQGDPNEHLYDEIPYYDYALVIDYNTANSPTGVRQGAGSAFFVHVSVGAPTAGCVSIAADQLVRIMRWLKPSAHPRILIGIA